MKGHIIDLFKNTNCLPILSPFNGNETFVKCGIIYSQYLLPAKITKLSDLKSQSFDCNFASTFEAHNLRSSIANSLRDKL